MAAFFSIPIHSQQTAVGTRGKQKLSTQPHEANCLDTSAGLGASLGAPSLRRGLGSPRKPNPLKCTLSPCGCLEELPGEVC